MWFRITYLYQGTAWIYIKVVKYVHVPVILSLIYTDKILQLINRGETAYSKICENAGKMPTCNFSTYTVS